VNYQQFYSKATRYMGSSLIRELVASTRNIPDLISFAGGFPSPKTFPKQILAELYAKVIMEDGADVLQYGASEGDNQLKRELLNWEGYTHLNNDNLLITVGATNAIYYYCRALIEPGDIILCEAPTFLGSLVAFDAVGARVRGISMDAEGIDLAELQTVYDKCRQDGDKPKFLYVIPDFQNPSGITMSAQRRHDLIQFALEHELPILEDNPYSRLRFTGEHLPTLYRTAVEQFDHSEIVTEVVSFSKILGPGMRMGFAKGNAHLIEKMCSWQQKVNVTPDCVTERVVARFLAEGYMPAHLVTITEFYKPYLETMLKALDKEMPSPVMWTRPEGGIFLWLWLPEGCNADYVFEQAKAHKITFVPGSKFFPKGEEQYNCLRLNYTYSSLEQIEQGVRRLGELMCTL